MTSALAFLCLALRHPLGALDGGLKGDSPGNFWVLGSYASKASSYHSNRFEINTLWANSDSISTPVNRCQMEADMSIVRY